MPEEKTNIVWVTPQVNKAMQIAKKLYGVRSANDALWLIIKNHEPELLEKASKSLAIERGE